MLRIKPTSQKQGGDEFPASMRTEEEIRNRDAEQHGNVKTNIHAADAGKAQGGGEEFHEIQRMNGEG